MKKGVKKGVEKRCQVLPFAPDPFNINE